MWLVRRGLLPHPSIKDAKALLDELAVTQFVILSGRLVPQSLLPMECSLLLKGRRYQGRLG